MEVIYLRLYVDRKSAYPEKELHHGSFLPLVRSTEQSKRNVGNSTRGDRFVQGMACTLLTLTC